MKLSIVIPVYNGAATVPRLMSRLETELGELYDLEVVLVNDDSPRDNSAEVCRDLARTHSWVRFVNLARNVGEHNAVMAGLNYCTGDAAVIMDDDFQNPPTEVVALVRKLEDGYDVVFASYERKKHNVFRNLGSWFNNLTASILIRKPLNLYLSSFKAINRFVINELVKYRGPYAYVDGLILRVTRHYASVPVRHDPRQEGRSGYTLGKLVALWLNMFTNFSILPLRLASLIGFLMALVALVMATASVIERILDPNLPWGWASMIVAVFGLSGVQLFAIGVLGEYLGRLFQKANGAPQFSVRDTVNCEPKTGVQRESLSVLRQ
jgi:polyisoprenyl-phosphate glycosyltransferase